MNQIAQLSTSHQLSNADRAAIADAENSLVGDEVLRPLASAVKERLQQFLVATEASAKEPAPVHDIAAEIGLLTFSFPSARVVSKDEAAIRLHEYTKVLRDLPLWAIREGFRRIKAGEAEGVSLDFPPAAPRLRATVLAVIEPLLRDRQQASRILAAREAPPENPEMAKRVKSLLETYGPNYGLDYPLPGAMPPRAAPEKQAPTVDKINAHYRNFGFGLKPRPVACVEPSESVDDGAGDAA